MSNGKERKASLVTFVNDVIAETKKATWPTRQELTSSTVAVIASVVLLGLFVGLCDEVLLFVLKLLTRAG